MDGQWGNGLSRGLGSIASRGKGVDEASYLLFNQRDGGSSRSSGPLEDR